MHIKKNMKQIYSVISAFILLSLACTKEESKTTNNTTNNTTDTMVHFATSIKPLFDSKCAISGCHVSGAQSPTLSNYAGIKANTAKIENRVIVLKNMPGGGLTMAQADRDKIKKWMDQGALDN